MAIGSGIPRWLERATERSRLADDAFYRGVPMTDSYPKMVHGILCHDADAVNHAAGLARSMAKRNARRGRPAELVSPPPGMFNSSADELARRMDKAREEKELQELEKAADEWSDNRRGAW